jgi:hypothetical protein
MKRTIAAVFSLCLLWCANAFATYDANWVANGYTQIQNVDELAGYCSSSNCWVSYPAAPDGDDWIWFTQGADGTVFGQTTGAHIYVWDLANQDWVNCGCNSAGGNQVTGMSDGMFSYTSSTAISANVAGWTSATSNNVYQYSCTGTTLSTCSWTNLSGLEASQVCISTTGFTIYALNSSNNKPYWWNSSNSTWSEVDPGSGVTIDSIACDDAGLYTIDSSGNLWTYTTVGWSEITPSTLGFTPSHAVGKFSESEGSMGVIDTSGKVWFSHDHGNTWTNPNDGGIGTGPKWITTGAQGFESALDSSGHAKHFNPMDTRVQGIVSGSYSVCPDGCGPENPNHSVTSYMAYTNGIEPGSDTEVGENKPWNDVFVETAYDEFNPGGCDSFIGVDTSDDCYISNEEGYATCPIAGVLLNVQQTIPVNPVTYVALVAYHLTGSGEYCGNQHGFLACFYTATNTCSSSTKPSWKCDLPENGCNTYTTLLEYSNSSGNGPLWPYTLTVTNYTADLVDNPGVYTKTSSPGYADDVYQLSDSTYNATTNPYGALNFPCTKLPPVPKTIT